MKKLIASLLLPVVLLGQVTSPPTDHDEGENPDSGGTEVVSQGTLIVTNLILKGNLTVGDGGIVIFKPDPDPDPDPQPGPNPDPDNENPVARMTYSPTAGDFPLLVSVDGTTSTDSDGTIASYSWNWGDATVTTGSTSSHTYASAGNYGITLTVTDDDGATSTTAPRIVNVTTAPVNQNPVAFFTVDVNTGTSPLTVNVDATGSYDTDGTIADPAGYVWDFDTGSPASGTGSTDSTTFTGAGIYTITLTVTDNDTLTASTTRQIEVAAAPVNPVASFTRSPTSGNAPLTVYVDGSGSSDPDGTIANYNWNWGDATTAGSGVTANHTYAAAGNYDITLTVTDFDTLTADASLPVQVYDSGLPEYEITTADTGYRHIELTWTDDQTWSYPWLIQRSTTPSFTAPTDLTDNQSVSTFRWLGVNANNYTDIEDLAEGTLYYYRVAACTNLAAHYRDGTTPQFTPWKYGAGTTGTLAAGLKQTYDVTSYGAVAGDGLNDFNAVTTALAAADAAGGGIVYFPAGVYDIWPIDADVDQEAGGQLYLPFGDSVNSYLFQIAEDNITFLGDGATTKLNLYLWSKQPATGYLSLRDAGNNETGIRRYYVFQTSGLVRDFTLKDMEIDMGATPVASGKEPGVPKTEWDITHKLFASFATTSSWTRNIVIDGVTAYNCRGEIIFVGGSNHGKFYVKDSNLHSTNASTFSGSFDMEVIDSTISDSANAAMEVNNKGNQTDKWDASTFHQNVLVRGCTIEGLKSGGAFEGLPGSKNFAGLLLFNEENTYQSVTDCTFRDVIKAAHGPWYEYRNGMRFNCIFYDPPAGYSGAQISLMTQPKTDYNIDGGMSETLWIGDKVYLGRSRLTQEIWMSSWDGVAAAGNQSPWIYAEVDFESLGGPHTLNRFWVDGWNHATGRQNVTFENFTTTSTNLSTSYMWDKYPTQKIHPTYINFFQSTGTPPAAGYYVSNSGSDSNDGLTPATAWQTLAKLNAASLVPGDNVFFNRGDTWTGTVTVNDSGTSGNPITYGVYGTGTTPRIYGSEPVTGWTVHSGSIYKAYLATTPTQVFQNGTRLQQARWPNSGDAVIDSINSQTSYNDTALPSGYSHVGSIAQLKTTTGYIYENRTVATSTGGVGFTVNSAPTRTIAKDNGYILIGNINYLTGTGQWHYDSSANTLYVWATDGADPDTHTMRASTTDYGMNFADPVAYVTIDGIDFYHQSKDGIHGENCSFITVQNCSFQYQDGSGFRAWPDNIVTGGTEGDDITLDNNVFVGHNVHSIWAWGDGWTITNNSFSDIGRSANLSSANYGWLFNGFGAICIWRSDAADTIRYNTFEDCGAAGTYFFDSPNITIEYNLFKNVGLDRNDGAAGIYCVGGGSDAGSETSENGVCRYNIIHTAGGSLIGAINGAVLGAGIYMDDYNKNWTIEYNTIIDAWGAGIFQNNGGGHTIRYNTVFDGGIKSLEDKTSGSNASAWQYNTVYCLDENTDETPQTQRAAHMTVGGQGSNFDFNTYINHYDAAAFRTPSGLPLVNFSTWKAHPDVDDANSTFDNSALTAGHTEGIIYNPTNAAITVSLGSRTFYDITGASKAGTLAIPAWSSVILTGLTGDFAYISTNGATLVQP